MVVGFGGADDVAGVLRGVDETLLAGVLLPGALVTAPVVGTVVLGSVAPEMLGRVTAAVVHAIFSIILLDAIFAMVYSELNI